MKRSSVLTLLNTPLIKFLSRCANKSNKNSNNKLREATDLTLVQQSFMLVTQCGFDLRLFCFSWMLARTNFLFDDDGIFRKSTISVVASQIERTYKCGKARKRCYPQRVRKFTLRTARHWYIMLHWKGSKRLLISLKHFWSELQRYFLNQSWIRIDVVFDYYDEISVKLVESKLRSMGVYPKQLIITSPVTKIPADYEDFFIIPENKLQLLRFLCHNALKFAGTIHGPVLDLGIQSCVSAVDSKI